MSVKEKNIVFNYDSEVDVLYAHVGEPRKGKVVFDEEGIVIKVDPKTNEFVGFTITNYMKRINRGLIKSIPNFENVKLPTYH